MDPTADYHTVRALRADPRSSVDRQRGQGWLQSQRPVDPGRGPVRVDLDSRFHLAYRAAHEPFYQASAPDAHRSDTLDGSYLRTECSEFILILISN